MQLRYDEDFVEAAVFLCASGRRKGAPALQVARFHRERERLYQVLDPDERNAAFFGLHLDWFREWGLESPLVKIVAEFPLVREKIGALAVRKTTAKKDEGAELYVNETGARTALLALRLERFLDLPSLEQYLRHEFTHLHDMLDPAFGYQPVLELPGLNPAQRRLAAERYRLIWDITIDGRLACAGKLPDGSREAYAMAFARSYSFWPEAKQEETFARLWTEPSPSHAAFLDLIADPRGLRDTQRPSPGGSCPLCEFPTFAWAPVSEISQEINDRIGVEFPGWSPENGLCSRCLETYQAVCRFAGVGASVRA